MQTIDIDVGSQIVRGFVWHGDTNWVVLLHEPGGDLDAWRELPAVINQSGYSVLAIDLPGHGLSDDPPEARRWLELVDALAAYAAAAGAKNVFIIAPGELASAAVVSQNVKAVVALSPKMPALFAPDKTSPVLILAGGADPKAVVDADAFFRALRGWAVFSSLGAGEQGVALFHGSWSSHALEQTLTFFHDYRES